MCQVRVSHKWVRWKMWQISIVSVTHHPCRHSGSWASSCFLFSWWIIEVSWIICSKLSAPVGWSISLSDRQSNSRGQAPAGFCPHNFRGRKLCTYVVVDIYELCCRCFAEVFGARMRKKLRKRQLYPTSTLRALKICSLADSRIEEKAAPMSVEMPMRWQKMFVLDQTRRLKNKKTEWNKVKQTCRLIWF